MKIEERIESNISQFYQSISESTPCGDDVEYSELFQRIEQQMSNVNEMSQWNDLLSDCEKLMLTTRDLRVAVVYTRILINTKKSPIEGVLQGLHVVSKWLDDFWDCMYPPIDTDDPEEAYIDRSNTLAILGGYKELILVLKKKNIISTAFDDYTLEEMIAFKQGSEMPAGKQAPVGLTEDEKSHFNDVLTTFLKAHQLAIEIKESFSEKSNEVFLDFDEYLIPILQEGADAFAIYSDGNESEQGDDESEILKQSIPLDSPQKQGLHGVISSREDVAKSIDMMCEYYANHEPSSPVPLLLKRAKRLVNNDFIEIIEELRLGSPANIEDLFGKPEEI